MFDSWWELTELLEKGGMTKNPWVYKACERFREYGIPELLEELIRDHPKLIQEAKRNVKEIEEDPFWPPPQYDYETEKLQGKYKLGIINPDGDELGIDPLDFTRILFTSGAIGSGKSYAINRILDQMLSTSPKERGFNIIVIEPTKGDTSGFLEHYPHLVHMYWDDIRYAGWECHDWDTPEDKYSFECRIFTGENYMKAQQTPLLKRAVKNCYKRREVFNFSDIKAELNRAAKEIGLAGYEHRNSMDKIKTRLTEFIDTGKILNCKQGYPFDFWLDNDICLNVAGADSDYVYRYFTLSQLLSIWRYYETNPLKNPQLRTLFVWHESRSLLNKKRDNDVLDSNALVERFFTTARSSGIGMIVCTQEPQSISEYVTSNAAFSWTFPVFANSIEAVKKLQGLNNEQREYIFKLPQYGTGIFRDPRFERAFLVDVPSTLDLESLSKDEVKEIMKPTIERLQAMIKKPEPKRKKEPEEEPTTLKERTKLKTAESNGYKILNFLTSKPFTKYTDIMKELKIPKDDFPQATAWLEKKGYIEKRKFKGATKPPHYLLITEKAVEEQDIPDSKWVRPNYFEHLLYCKHLKEWLEGGGYQAQKEYRLPGVSGRIDVYAEMEGKKTAYELTLHFDNLVSNVIKCLKGFKVDELNIVCRDKEGIEKAKTTVEKSGQVTANQMKKIKFMQIRDFL